MRATKLVCLTTVCGIAVGGLIAVLETMQAAMLPGGEFRPNLLVDGTLLNGGVLGFSALLVAVGWWFVGRARRRRRRTAAVPSVRANPARSGALSRRCLLAITGLLSLCGVAVGLRPRESDLQALPNEDAPLLPPAALPAPAAAASRGPNLLLITVDTLRADQLGSYGHPYVKTPALDKLASQGARFRWHLVQQPQTNPSHASIFTGTYPTTNGLRVHMVDKLSSAVQTIAAIYQDAGYRTAGLYSWMSFDPEYSDLQQGFETYENVAPRTPGALSSRLLKQVAARYREADQYLSVPQLIDQFIGVKRQVESDAKGRADVTTDAAIIVLQSLANSPFALWVHYFDPHYPYQPPDPYPNLYDSNYQGPVNSSMDTVNAIENGKLDPTGADRTRLVSLYQAEITYADQHIGRLVDALDALELTQNTIVAVTGDHGESFEEHSSLYVRGDFFHPHSLYNTELAVPLILRYSDKLRAGVSSAVMTQSVDILPTLLDMSGLPTPDQVQGQALSKPSRTRRETTVQPLRPCTTTPSVPSPLPSGS